MYEYTINDNNIAHPVCQTITDRINHVCNAMRRLNSKWHRGGFSIIMLCCFSRAASGGRVGTATYCMAGCASLK